MAFSSEGSFTCHICCDTEPPFIRSFPKDPRFFLPNAEGAIATYFYVLDLTQSAQAGLELVTFRLLSESATTRLPQPQCFTTPLIVCINCSCLKSCRLFWRFLFKLICYFSTDMAQFHGTQFGFHPTALSVFTFFFSSDFQPFRPEHNWRDLSSRNEHLVHQNW
jgi:hypothetical protein